MNLLHIDWSITGDQSVSRQTDPLPHHALQYEHERGRAAAGASLEEFLDADVVVTGAPTYNFAIPSQLKAWIDALIVAGRTFKYTEHGPQGLTVRSSDE
jgi:FMN-dependent NADH-azoreductase